MACVSDVLSDLFIIFGFEFNVFKCCFKYCAACVGNALPVKFCVFLELFIKYAFYLNGQNALVF